jgi:putative ABC transport system permease protein
MAAGRKMVGKNTNHRLNVFSVFSRIAMSIAFIGLFGFVSFLATAKTKEIGLRNVLRNTVWYSITQLSREFMILVLPANAVALPLVLFFVCR